MKRTKLTPSKSVSTLTKLTTTPVSRGRDNPDATDENKKPLSTPRSAKPMSHTYKLTKTKSTCHLSNKGNEEDTKQGTYTSRTPLTSASRLNRANVQSSTKTPSTPKRGAAGQRTPTKLRTTPIKAKHSLLVEFR